MLDKNILNIIEKRIVETRETKKELSQSEWDREYLFKALLELVRDSAAEIMSKLQSDGRTL
jgi:hypothetical protein